MTADLPANQSDPALELEAITAFDWAVYADATFAGLAVLIPIPVVDFIVEEYFRRRMPRDIAARNGRTLHPGLVIRLNRRRADNQLLGCLLLPLRLVFYLFRNIFRTVLYALSVVDAADNLGYYWHRAFLINYAVRRGHLDDPATAATRHRRPAANPERTDHQPADAAGAGNSGHQRQTGHAPAPLHSLCA